MGKNNYDIFYDDKKTKDELISNCIICKTSYSDIVEIIGILSKSFGIYSEREVVKQLLYSNADLDNSVKIIDKRDNKIYGLLILSKFPINIGSPIAHIDAPLNDYLSNYTQVNGHSFIIDIRLRGTSFDKKMLHYQKNYINEYDFIWCGVEKELKTHKYWEHLGFMKLFETDEAIFYIYPKNKKILFDIFILKILPQNV